MSNHADNISTRPDAEPKPVGSVAAGEVVIGFAVLGMMFAGTIGLVHAWKTTDGLTAAACIAASAAAFGAVCLVYLRRS